MKRGSIIFCIAAVLLSCRKDPSVVLSTTLTNCPDKHTCSYSYFDNADFNISQVVHGGSRVFQYTSTDSLFCNATALFNVRVALSANSFDITSAQIAAGQVIWASDLICPCCNYLAAKPIGGEITGKRVSASTWLLNARIIFGNSASHPTDSIKVNQYFTLEKLP